MHASWESSNRTKALFAATRELGTSFTLSQPEGTEKTGITGFLERTGVEVPELEEDRRRPGIIVRLRNLNLRMKILRLAQLKTTLEQLRHLRGAEGSSQHHPPAEPSAASLGKQSLKPKPRKLAEAEVNMRVMQVMMEQQSKNDTLKRDLEAAEIARNTARRQRCPIQSKYKRNCIVMQDTQWNETKVKSWR